jgi:hypothetical protein
MEAVVVIAPVALLQGIFLMITSLYCSIHLRHVPKAPVLLSVLGIVGSIAFFALKTALALGMKMTENSALFAPSYLRNERRLKRVDLKFYQSCPPFIVQTGIVPAITKQTFVYIINDAVVFSVINLLLTFR